MVTIGGVLAVISIFCRLVTPPLGPTRPMKGRLSSTLNASLYSASVYRQYIYHKAVTLLYFPTAVE